MNPWDNYQYGASEPLFRVGRVPVYVTTLFVALQVIALVIFSVAGYAPALIGELVYTTPAIMAGKLWTLVTYAFVDQLNFFTALGLFFFYLFGRPVEMRLGTRRYLIFLGVLTVAPTLLLTLLGITGILAGSNSLLGSMNIHLCVLIAFIWFNSEAMFWGGIPAKWLGIFFVALQTLQLMGMRQWVPFWMCWFSLLVAYITLRRMGMGKRFAAIEEPILNALPKRKPKGYRSSKRKLRVVKGKAKPKKHRYESKLAPTIETSSASSSVDHLLDKISKQGLSSLTPEERQQLEKASDQLSDDN